MVIKVTKNAREWLKDEFHLTGQNGIRLFARYGGASNNLHPGFSIGVAAEKPKEPVIKEEKDGFLVFIEERDEWYFKGYNWEIDYNPDLEETRFSHSKA